MRAHPKPDNAVKCRGCDVIRGEAVRPCPEHEEGIHVWAKPTETG